MVFCKRLPEGIHISTILNLVPGPHPATTDIFHRGTRGRTGIQRRQGDLSVGDAGGILHFRHTQRLSSGMVLDL